LQCRQAQRSVLFGYRHTYNQYRATVCDILCVVSCAMSGTMCCDVKKAIALIDQLLSTFGPVSTNADEIVGQAKILWQQDQQSDVDFVESSEARPPLSLLKHLYWFHIRD